MTCRFNTEPSIYSQSLTNKKLKRTSIKTSNTYHIQSLKEGYTQKTEARIPTSVSLKVTTNTFIEHLYFDESSLPPNKENSPFISA